MDVPPLPSPPGPALALMALLSAGCAAGAPCEAELTDAGTVPRVRWTGGAARVEYGIDGELDQATPEVEGGSALLLGLPPLRDVDWRVVAGEEAVCEGTIRTGNLPAGLPDLQVTLEADGRSSEPWWIVTTMGGQGAVLLLNRDGERLWGMDLGAELTSEAWVVAHDDGEPTIVFNRFDEARVDTNSELHEIGFDNASGRVWSTPGAHHVFTPTPGGFGFPALDPRLWVDPDLGAPVKIAGDAIGEVDEETGAVRMISSTWDWLLVEKHERWDDAFYPGMVDWTHANSLIHDPADDTYVISLSNTGIVAHVDASTGMPIQTYGRHGTFAPADEASAWRWAHDTSFTPDGHLLMFATHPIDTTRGALELEIDAESRLLRKVWSYGFDEGNGYTLGQAIRLANGNTLVNNGDGGVLREVTPEGEVVWEMEAPLGTWFAQVHPMYDIYAGR